jgi:long-chain acyl-CoA synthetase
MHNLVHSLLVEQSASRGYQVAYEYGQETVTFADLNEQCRSMAGYFQVAGIQPRQVVLIHCQETLLWPVCWFALLLLGAIPVAVPVTHATDDLPDLVERTHAQWIIVDQLISPVQCAQLVLATDVLQHVPLTEIYDYQPTDEIFYILSSGTSSRPKIIVHVAGGLDRAFVETTNPYGFSPQSTVFTTVGLCSSWGMLISLLGVLAVGHKVILRHASNNFARIEQMLVDSKVTHLLTAPRMISFLTKHCQTLPQTMQRVYVSGESCDSSVIAEFEDKFKITVLDSYGCSEIRCWAVLINHPNHTRMASLGVAGDNVILKLVDQQGKECAVGKIGRLVVKHDCVFTGYKHDAKSTGNSLTHGWYITQDFMKKDQDGFYYFVGRENDMIQLADGLTSLIEIEKKLGKLLGTNDLVITQDNQNRVMFLKQNQTGLAQDQLVSDHVDKIYIVSQIPVTEETGKKVRNFNTLIKYVV